MTVSVSTNKVLCNVSSGGQTVTANISTSQPKIFLNCAPGSLDGLLSLYAEYQNQGGQLSYSDFRIAIIDQIGEISFETVSKNLKSWNASFAYTGGDLTEITYTDGINTVVKTLTYDNYDLASISLSGDTPSGIQLTKSFAYTNGDLTQITYG